MKYNFDKARTFLVQYYMKNPDLGEELDYQDDSTRLEEYTRQMNDLNEKEISDMIQLFYAEDYITIEEVQALTECNDQ
jgi:hypothetical protein